MKKIDIINEVYTEKQRKWACYQMDAPKSEREISKKNATEMCKDVKHSKKKNEIAKPKMKKKDLVEYINTKISLKENGEVFIVTEIPSVDKREIFRFFEQLRQSGVINMFGSYPILNWTKDDLHRWLYGMGKDVESMESEIEELEYDNEEGENDSDIELLQSQLEPIKYLLDNKNNIRDILIRGAMTRLENRGEEDPDLSKVQRVFENLAKECFKMWTTAIYGNR